MGNRFQYLLWVIFFLGGTPVAHSIDVSDLIQKIQTETGWRYVRLNHDTSTGMSFLFRSSGGVDTEIHDLVGFQKEIELKGTVRAGGETTSYFFPEFEENAAKAIEEKTTWQLRIIDTPQGMTFRFIDSERWSFFTEKPSELLAEMKEKGLPRMGHGYSVFFPQYERNMAETLATALKADVSYEEPPGQIRCIFKDQASGRQFVTIIDVATLNRSLASMGARKLRERLFNPSLYESANELATTAKWALTEARFLQGRIYFIYENDLYRTSNPRRILANITVDREPLIKSGRLKWLRTENNCSKSSF